MFRRKEEGSADSTDTTTSTTGLQSSTTGSTTGADSSYQASSGTSSTSPSASSYSSQPPQMQPVVRTVEPSRPTPTPSSTYRPNPVSDFNRGARPGSVPSSFGAGKEAGKANPRILTVGNDILLKGEIATCDRVVIEGRVEAKLNDVHTVEIAESGSFKGTAEVEDAEISGLFEGDLAVRNRLVVYATGEVRGNITYGEIEIARGGKLTGQIKTVSGDSKSGKTNLLDVLDAKARSKDGEAA